MAVLRRRYYQTGDSGDVREYLELLRRNNQKRKAAVKLDIDIQTLEEFWPHTLNVAVKNLKGYEPLKELKRQFEGIAYRIFFCIRGDEMWLLSAFEKESDETPKHELEKAYKRMKEILEAKT